MCIALKYVLLLLPCAPFGDPNDRSLKAYFLFV